MIRLLQVEILMIRDKNKFLELKLQLQQEVHPLLITECIFQANNQTKGHT
jgi:hypothetical protein